MHSLDSLLKYDSSSGFCVFGYNSNNLGDYIQTLALLQHVTPRLRVARDSFSAHPELSLIANGWMTKGEFPTRTDFREIRYLGIHISRWLRTAETAELINEASAPVGARDLVTAEFLRANGVDTAVCGCATTTFPTFKGERHGAICVDVPIWVEAEVERFFGVDAVDAWSHSIEKAESFTSKHELERFQYAYSVLWRYARAELVVTSRIHAALPAAALGTKVLFAPQKDDRQSIWSGLDFFRVPRSRWGLRQVLRQLAARQTDVGIEAHRDRFIDFMKNTCLA